MDKMDHRLEERVRVDDALVLPIDRDVQALESLATYLRSHHPQITVDELFVRSLSGHSTVGYLYTHKSCECQLTTHRCHVHAVDVRVRRAANPYEWWGKLTRALTKLGR